MRQGVEVGADRRRPAAAVLAALATLSIWLPTSAAAAPGGGYAGASGDAGAPGPSGRTAQPFGALPGIDVSHHQDLIDWAQVAASGQRFAIAKATEGRSFVDDMYAINKIGAEANGIVFGAYHFAQPDDFPGDAILEADHFVDTAQLGPGNLIPVLDIERTGGLSQAEVTAWILEWLGRVTERLGGVRPMVYTSPSGWENRTGDTTAVAAAGYTVLWVAHWDTDEPRLPADEWGGNGWTFWQYDNCGSIPGIDGCVDVDWYETSSFDPVTIPSPDVAPPIATISPPVEVDEAVTITFNEVVRNVTTDNVYVWSPASATYPEFGLSCRNRQGAEVDCATGNVRTVFIQPVEPLVPGESYEVVVNPPLVLSPVVDRSGNPALAAVQAFAPPTEVEDTSAAVSYGWREVTNRRAHGRAYAVEHREGATASFEFRGRSVTWFTATGPAQGAAAVRIDGEPAGTFDQFASSTSYRVARRFTGLARGPHTITIRVLGRGSPGATDTQVVVDAFEAGGDLVANPELEARWATNGAVASSDLAGASAEFVFRGTGARWTTVRNRNQGKAEIWVDDVLVKTVDNYAANPVSGVERSVSGLADGLHVLRIVVLGEGRPAATGTLVSVDRLAVVTA